MGGRASRNRYDAGAEITSLTNNPEQRERIRRE